MATKDDDQEVKRVQQIQVNKLLDLNPKKVRALVDGKKEAIFLARVGGIVVDSFSGTNKKDDSVWYGLNGIFSMLAHTGERFQSTVCFLPNNAVKPIVENLNQGVTEIRFAYDIYVQETDKTPVGYAFLCEPIVSEEAMRKAQLVSEQIFSIPLPGAKQKTLAAPKKAA